MTGRLYHADPYCREFDAAVVEVRGDWVILDRTAFYPGGGGQEPDRGFISGIAVTEVKQEKDAVLHKAPGHGLKSGDPAHGVVDWGRRYDLMRGHSGEHLLFSCLQKLEPALELVKISITPDKKSIMVRGELNWDIAIRAGMMVHEAITSAHAISERRVRKEDPALQEARVKLDRIHGEEVRIVEIGDVDKAACAGIHVRNTAELGMVLITKFTSARPAADFEVEFEVGEKAKRRAVELSVSALRSAELLGASPQDLLSALDNLKKEGERRELALRRYGVKALAELLPSEIGGTKLYSGIFECMDKKTIAEAANGFVEEGAACILGSVGERFVLIVACPPSKGVDCAAVLGEALRKVGGKGGGKPSFASGGAPQPERAEEAMVEAILAMRKALECDRCRPPC